MKFLKSPLAVVSLTLFLAVYFVFLTARYPYIGIKATIDTKGYWTIATIDHPSWASMHASVGDRILQVNEQDPSENIKLQKYGTLEMVDSVLLENQDGTREKHDIAPFTSSQPWGTLIFLPSALLIITALVSFTVYRKQWVRAEVKLLVLFAMCVAMSYLGSEISGRRDIIANPLVTSMFSLAPILLMHYIHTYCKTQGARFLSFWIVKAGYLAVLGTAVLRTLYLLIPYSNLSLTSILTAANLFIFVVLNIVTLSTVILRYFRSTPQLRPFYTTILLGQIISFGPFIVLNALPRLLWDVVIVPTEFAAIGLFAMPIMYLYLLTSEQLFDVDFLLRRLRYYVALSLIPAALLCLMLYLICHHESMEALVWARSFLLIYAATVVFLFVKESLDLRMRPYWFKDKHNYQKSLDSFTARISKLMKSSELEMELLREIHSVLPVRSAAILEIDPASGDHLIKQSYGDPGSLVVKHIQRQVGLAAAAGQFISVPSGLCFAFGVKSGRLQLLWFDNKTNQTKFNPDEIAWAKTLLNYVTVVYQNLLLVENFMGELEQSVAKDKLTPPWLLRLLFSISENERRRLSSDLHDSALQDQLLWYRRLESMISGNAFVGEIRQGIEEIRDGLLDVIAQIRETCNELRPPFLKEMGIVEAVQNLLTQMRLRTNSSIELSSEHYDAELDENQVLTLYRIIQELLQNASKHSNAAHIQLYLGSTPKQIIFTYRDDGIGMNLGQLKSSFSHMGLWSIKERVASLEGTAEFYSEPGKGFTVNITIPAVSVPYLHTIQLKPSIG